MVIHENVSVYDAICTMFLEDVGTLFVVDDNAILVGVLSRKDLLRAVIMIWTGIEGSSCLPMLALSKSFRESTPTKMALSSTTKSVQILVGLSENEIM